MIGAVVLILFLVSVAFGAGNQPVNVLPDSNNSSFRTQSRLFWQNELPAILGRYFPTGWVYTGENANSGLHGIAASCTSPAFQTEAFTKATLPGNDQQDRVLGSSDTQGHITSASINYATQGVPGCTTGTTVVRVVACSVSGNSVSTNFARVPSTNYFTDYVDTNPITPPGCAILMDVTVTNGAIVAVRDLRHKSPFSSSDVCSSIEESLHMVIVSCHATGGDGTSTQPWTGWDTAITWHSGNDLGGGSNRVPTGVHYFLPCGNYIQHVKVILPGNMSFVQGDPSGGMNCVRITHVPTGSADADGYYTMWEFGHLGAHGGSFLGRFENIEIYSEDITHVKRAVHLIDVRNFTIRNFSLFGFNPDCTYTTGTAVNGIGYCDTVTYNTRGIDIQGREFVRLEDVWVVANRPVYVAGSPVGGQIPDVEVIENNFDISSWTNVAFWQSPSTIPIPHASPIFFDPQVFVSNFNIDGHCSLIGGQHFIYMDQSARPSDGSANQSWGIVIENCRGEQVDTHSDEYRYVFIGNTVSNAPPLGVMHGLTFRNVDISEGGIGRGWFLENVASVLFENCTYGNANYNYHPTHTNIAVHLGPNAYPVTFLNSWIVDSSFIEVTGNQCIMFNAGYNGRFGPLGGSPLVVFDVTDSTAPVGAGCMQQPILTPAQANADIGGFHPPVLASIHFIPSLIGDTGAHPGADDNVYQAEDHTNVDPLLWTPAGQIGYWTRSGQLVHLFARIRLTTKGTWSGVVSMNFHTGAVSNSNYPPPLPAPWEAMRQVMNVHFEKITFPFSCFVQAPDTACAVTVATAVPEPSGGTYTGTGTCVVTDGTCTTPNTYTSMVAVMEPHFAEGAPGLNSNVTFRLQGNNMPEALLTWDMVANDTFITVSGTYVTER